MKKDYQNVMGHSDSLYKSEQKHFNFLNYRH